MAAVLGFFIISLDVTAVNVALPAIGSDLHGRMTDLQWIVDGYTLPFAALLLSAGASVAIAADPVVGGALTSGASWQLIFFVNLPLGLAVLALLTRAHRSVPRRTPLDPAGQLIATVALAALRHAPGVTVREICGNSVGFPTGRGETSRVEDREILGGGSLRHDLHDGFADGR
ncbi:hypothetical protein [Streptomyces sirii]|uniref:hypothetical protein n=1 Tax=Streptomyces sirii TaxID=3127701 RepID=UPI003D3691C6